MDTRTGVSKLRGPALGCLSARQKCGLIFCKHNCISLPHRPESGSNHFEIHVHIDWRAYLIKHL